MKRPIYIYIYTHTRERCKGFRAVSESICVFWDETLCHWVRGCLCFEEPQRFHIQGLSSPSIMGCLVLDDKVTTMLRNVGNHSPGTASHPQNPTPRFCLRSIWAVSKTGHTLAMWTQPSPRPQHVTVRRTHWAANLMCTGAQKRKRADPQLRRDTTSFKYYVSPVFISPFLISETTLGQSAGSSATYCMCRQVKIIYDPVSNGQRLDYSTEVPQHQILFTDCDCLHLCWPERRSERTPLVCFPLQ